MLDSYPWMLVDPTWQGSDNCGWIYLCFDSGLFYFGPWWCFFVGAWVCVHRGYNFEKQLQHCQIWSLQYHKCRIHGRIDGLSVHTLCLGIQWYCNGTPPHGPIRHGEPLLGVSPVRRNSQMLHLLQWNLDHLQLYNNIRLRIGIVGLNYFCIV
jgi:hypothetical protein